MPLISVYIRKRLGKLHYNDTNKVTRVSHKNETGRLNGTCKTNVSLQVPVITMLSYIKPGSKALERNFSK